MRVLHKLLNESARRGWSSQRKVESALGFPQGRIHRWLKGVGEPSWSEVVKWAKAVDVPLEYLADELQDSPKPPEISAEERHLLAVLRQSGVSPTQALAWLLSPLRNAPREDAAVEVARRGRAS